MCYNFFNILLVIVQSFEPMTTTNLGFVRRSAPYQFPTVGANPHTMQLVKHSLCVFHNGAPTSPAQQVIMIDSLGANSYSGDEFWIVSLCQALTTVTVLVGDHNCAVQIKLGVVMCVTVHPILDFGIQYFLFECGTIETIRDVIDCKF